MSELDRQVSDMLQELRDAIQPGVGWEVGMCFLLTAGICPWCCRRISNVTLAADGGPLTWACPGECNP